MENILGIPLTKQTAKDLTSHTIFKGWAITVKKVANGDYSHTIVQTLYLITQHVILQGVF